jgi:NADH:ubiquinone reductase (H+-translocating)
MLTIDNPETGEHFKKRFGPGDHFGERVLLRSSLRTGLVVALEDSVVLFIAQKDFTRFARAFPILDAYFKEYIQRTFGGVEKSFAPGSANHEHELETLP